MIKQIIFDAFGTLFSVEKGASANAVLVFLKNHRIPIDETAFHREWKSFYAQATSSSVFQTERAIFTNRIQYFLDPYHLSASSEKMVDEALHIACNRSTYPDVLPLLHLLSHHYSLSIASNTDNMVLQAVMERHPLPVHSIFTSEDLQCYKPSPAFYHKILNHLQCDPSQCLFVGDSYEEDVHGPSSAGMHAVLLNRAGMHTLPCPSIQTLLDLPKFIAEIR